MKIPTLLFAFICVILVTPLVHASLLDGLHAYYSFDSEGNASTSASYQEPLIFRNGAKTTNVIAISGKSLQVDGINDYADTSASTATPTILTNQVPISISFWLYSNATDNRMALDSSNGAGSGGYVVQMYPASQYTAGMAGVAVAQGGSYTTQTWNHMVYIHNSSGQYLYQNTTLVNSGAGGVPIAGYETFIGSAYNGASMYYSGFIDELGVWNKTLTDAEIQTLFTEHNPFSYDVVALTSATTVTGSPLTTFSATLNGTLYSTTNGTIYLPVNYTDNRTYELVVTSSDHFSRIYTMAFSGSTYVAHLHQVVIQPILVTDLITNSTITGGNLTYCSSTCLNYSWDSLPLNLSAGTITFTHPLYQNSSTIVIPALFNDSFFVSLLPKSVNILTYNERTNQLLTSLSGSLNNTFNWTTSNTTLYMTEFLSLTRNWTYLQAIINDSESRYRFYNQTFNFSSANTTLRFDMTPVQLFLTFDELVNYRIITTGNGTVFNQNNTTIAIYKDTLPEGLVTVNYASTLLGGNYTQKYQFYNDFTTQSEDNMVVFNTTPDNYHSFRVMDSNNNIISGAYVLFTTLRANNTWGTSGLYYTDADGYITFHGPQSYAGKDHTYRLYAFKDGYSGITQTRLMKDYYQTSPFPESATILTIDPSEEAFDQLSYFTLSSTNNVLYNFTFLSLNTQYTSQPLEVSFYNSSTNAFLYSYTFMSLDSITRGQFVLPAIANLTANVTVRVRPIADLTIVYERLLGFQTRGDFEFDQSLDVVKVDPVIWQTPLGVFMLFILAWIAGVAGEYFFKRGYEIFGIGLLFATLLNWMFVFALLPIMIMEFIKFIFNMGGENV